MATADMATWDGSFMDVDPMTLTEIIRIQLEDSYQLTANDKGKKREGDINDAQLALQMLQDDLRDCDATLKDRRLAQSIATAVLQDGDLIYRAYQNEQQIEKDKELAMKLAGDDVSCADDPAGADNSHHSKEPDVWSDDEMLAKAAALYVQKPQYTGTTNKRRKSTTQVHAVAESSARAAAREEVQEHLKGQCIACGDEFEFFDVARVPCNHEYCRECLAELFTLSMKDESLFPPRCCQSPIPLPRVRFFLPKELATEFETKAVELGTKNRVYCHSSACSTFIPPENINIGTDTATCPVCEKTTCIICKQVAHSGDCPDDTALLQLMEIADQKQWQRCYACHTFVELETGCNHMRCRYCKAEFCYVCGQKWKTCRCDQWAEGRLTARAIEVIDRDPNRRLYQPPRQPRPQPPTPRRLSMVKRPRFGDSNFQIGEAPEVPTLANATAESTGWESDFSDHSVWEEDWFSEDEKPIEPALRWSFSRSSSTIGLTSIKPARVRASEDQARQQLIARTVEHLRRNHVCSHKRWDFVRGTHRCEECRHVLKQYIFDCAQCHLRACNRCRRNRL